MLMLGWIYIMIEFRYYFLVNSTFFKGPLRKSVNKFLYSGLWLASLLGPWYSVSDPGASHEDFLLAHCWGQMEISPWTKHLCFALILCIILSLRISASSWPPWEVPWEDKSCVQKIWIYHHKNHVVFCIPDWQNWCKYCCGLSKSHSAKLGMEFSPYIDEKCHHKSEWLLLPEIVNKILSEVTHSLI